MAADVQVLRITGPSGTQVTTDITSINTRAQANDSHTTAGTTDPVQVPDTGTNYAYWVTTRLNANTAPSGTIDNIRWYTDGTNSLGTGLTCVVNTASSYVQATGTQGETGDQLTTGNHAGLAGSPTDAFAYTSASPLSVTGSTTTTGEFGDYVVWQIEVADTAGPGASSQETFTFTYDET